MSDFFNRALDAYDMKVKLEKFRKHFLYLTSDGAYPPDRQQVLYQWCQRGHIDWAIARHSIRDDAIAFFKRAIQRMAANGSLHVNEVREIQQLQRRLGLTNEQAGIDTLLGLVERKLLELVVSRAAYLSADPAVLSLKDAILAYQLPPERAARLVAAIDRQAALSKLLAGELPITAPPVALYRNEACHFAIKVLSALLTKPASRSGEALLVVTSQRVMLLTPGGGAAALWREVEIRFKPPTTIQLQLKDAQTVMFFRENQDVQYIATLLVGASKKYNPTRPTPAPPNKRLS